MSFRCEVHNQPFGGPGQFVKCPYCPEQPPQIARSALSRKEVTCRSCGAKHYEGDWCGCYNPQPPAPSALDRQEGGSHYKDMPIQPVQFCHANKIPFLDGNVIKYVCRHRAKNGKQDLLKARQYIDMLIELEYPDA